MRPDGLPLRLPPAYYQVESKARAILLPRARLLFEGRTAIFIDARSTDEFEQARIQGSFSVPLEEWQSLYSDLLPWIEGQTVVIYAAPEQAGRADELARGLISRGFDPGRLFVYVGGVDEWRAAHLPVEAGPAPSLRPEDDEGGW